MEESTKRLGEFFAKSREAKGLSQREAAARSTAQSLISAVRERQNVTTLGRALIMCEVYGKSPSQMAQAMKVTADQ